MRYVAGSDLRTVLKAHERISPGQALLLIGQAGRALDAAHRLGLVHRDVKPANVLIERGADGDPDHVYIADFGLTKHTLSRSGLTATGQMLGTIDYIAPEQIQGKTVDGRADIYSLGCVLYECLTGHVPFVKDVDAAVIWAHVEELPTPPSVIRPELPGGIDEVIMRALAKDPNDRYPTCRDFVGAATAALEPFTQTSGSRASDADIAAGPQTVLSGGDTHEPPPPLPPAQTSGTGASDADIAAGPQTVLSGGDTHEPPPPLPPAQTSGTGASDADIAAGPQTVLSGGDTHEPPPPLPPAQTSGAGASDADIAAGPQTVLSGGDTHEPPPPLPPAQTSGAPFANGGSHEGTPTPQEAGVERSPGSTDSGDDPVAARGADSRAPAPEQPPPPPGKPGRGGLGARDRRRAWYAAVLAVLVVGAVAAVLLTSSSSTKAGELSSSVLGQVPTNHVTGTGNATVRLSGDVATVTVTTSGLDNDDSLVHAMHIHAGGKGECPPASAARVCTTDI